MEAAEIAKKTQETFDGLWVVVAVKGKGQRFVTALHVFKGLRAADAYASAENAKAERCGGKHRYIASSIMGGIRSA